MLSNKPVAAWVIKHGETVRIAERHNVGLARVEAHVYDLELDDLLLCVARLVHSLAQRGMWDCLSFSAALLDYAPVGVY